MQHRELRQCLRKLRIDLLGCAREAQRCGKCLDRMVGYLGYLFVVRVSDLIVSFLVVFGRLRNDIDSDLRSAYSRYRYRQWTVLNQRHELCEHGVSLQESAVTLMSGRCWDEDLKF